ELSQCAGTYAAVFRATVLRPTLLEVLALLRAALGAKPDASQGLVIAKAHYVALGGHRDVDEPERDLHRRLRRHHLVLLRAGAMVGGKGGLTKSTNWLTMSRCTLGALSCRRPPRAIRSSASARSATSTASTRGGSACCRMASCEAPTRSPKHAC